MNTAFGKEIKSRLKHIKVFALDMDGTIYLGKYLFPFSKNFLDELKKKGKDFIFLTNNSSKNADDYVIKLQGMGLDIIKTQIYTSGNATIEFLNKQKPGAKIYLMGTQNLVHEFRSSGFQLVDNNPDFVVLGFDLTFTYEKFDLACRFIRHGVPFIATHPDYNCPLEGGDMLPDCGALSAAITAATGVKPKVIGKPNKELLDGLLNRTGIQKEELCIMGDRLMTDIRLGQDFGILSILVLTGETKKDDLKNTPFVPDLVLDRNIDLLTYL